MIRAEAGTIADAITKAARIAPARSSITFEKCAGVLIERSGDGLRICATDLSCSYSQRIGVLEAGDEPFAVRLPSDIAAGLIGNLPMGSGSEVILELNGRELKVRCGRARVMFRTMDADTFPKVREFDEDGLVEVEGFTRRVKQIAWAADRKQAPITGIFADGEVLAATDGKRVAFVPCPMPVERPVSAPLAPLTSVLKFAEDVRVRVTDRRFEIVPGDDVQLTATLYEQAYPDVRRVLPAADDLAATARFERDAFRDSLTRMIAFVKADDSPQMQVTFLAGEIHLDITLPDVGELHEEFDCDEGPDEPIEMLFDPKMLSGILTNAARESMSIAMTTNALHPVRFTDASGFLAWVMPVRRI